MDKLKRSAIGLLILTAFYLSSYLLTFYQPPKQSTQVLSAVTNVDLFQQPESGRQPLINAIYNAYRSIKIEVYLLSDKEFLTALLDAHRRGIDIKVILERDPFGGGSINHGTKALLEKNNISVRWSNPDYALTHIKTIIIDDVRLYILNQNLTASAFDDNREYNVVDGNPHDIKQMNDIFEADWERKPPPLYDSHLLISPVNSRLGLTNILQKAENKIDIEIEIINDRKIIEFLSNKAKSVKIRLIAPSVDQIPSNKEALLILTRSGVEVRTLESPYLHAKLILIDDSLAYTGSINLSSQSMDNNRELGIIISEAGMLTDLNDYFQRDWELSLAF